MQLIIIYLLRYRNNMKKKNVNKQNDKKNGNTHELILKHNWATRLELEWDDHFCLL